MILPTSHRESPWLEEVEQKEQMLEFGRPDCYQIMLDGLLPVPGPNASLPADPSHFSSDRDELLTFRISVNKMIQEALQSPEPMQTIMDNRTKIELALEQVHPAARVRRIQLGAAAVAAATGIAATASFGGEEAIKWVFDGIGASVAIAVIARALRYPRRESDVSYLVKSHRLTESGEVPYVPALTERPDDSAAFTVVAHDSRFA